MNHNSTTYFSSIAKRGLILAALGFAVGSAHCHDVWFDVASPATTEQYLVRFTDDTKPVPYTQDKLTKVWGYDAAGKILVLKPVMEGDLARVTAPPEAVLLALEFDNGFYSRTTQGTVNKPMNEAVGAVSAVWAQKAGKHVTQWGATAQKPIGLRLEIVPLAAVLPKSGDTLTVQVLSDGKPVEGVKVSKGEHESGVKTDEQGRATYKVGPGRNFVWAERRVKVEGDPRYDTLAVSTNLVFTVN